jgi:catechol 2,3-dioxygenase-like lactoylglutathione lyase family enzyme
MTPRPMLVHAELHVRAIASSLAFYVAGLGMQRVGDEAIEGPLLRGGGRAMRGAQLRSGPVGPRLLLLEIGDHELAQRPHRGALTVLVDELAPRIAQLHAAGFEPASAVFHVELPRLGSSAVVFYRDPDGHAIELLAAARAR